MFSGLARSCRTAVASIVRPAATTTNTAAPALHTLRRHFASSPSTQQSGLTVRRGGRATVSGVTATVFGATGFMGRYVVERLGEIGSQVIVPYRGDGMNTRHLKVMGDLGQIVPIKYNVFDKQSIRDAVEESNVVINLIGLDHETDNYSYDDAHYKCTRAIADVCKEMGIKRFVHMSCEGASNDSKSEYFRSKQKGEDYVRSVYPEATIFRPSQVFGDEDRFLTKIADIVNFSSWFPVVNRGDQLLQPVWANDVAVAVVEALKNDATMGETYFLGGPQQKTLKEVIEYVEDKILLPKGDCAVTTVPEEALTVAGFMMEFMPHTFLRLLTRDQVQAMKENRVPTADALASGRVKTFADLSIAPTSLDQRAALVLLHHRYDRDPVRVDDHNSEETTYVPTWEGTEVGFGRDFKWREEELTGDAQKPDWMPFVDPHNNTHLHSDPGRPESWLQQDHVEPRRHPSNWRISEQDLTISSPEGGFMGVGATPQRADPWEHLQGQPWSRNK